MFCFVITKNSNWETLTKNFVTFKRQDRVKDENFNILGVHQKIKFLGGLMKKGGFEKTIYKRGLHRNGGLDSLHT